MKSLTNRSHPHIIALRKRRNRIVVISRKSSGILTSVFSFYDIYASYDILVQRTFTTNNSHHTEYLQKNSNLNQTTSDYTKECLTIFVSILTHLRYRTDYVTVSCSSDGCLVQGKRYYEISNPYYISYCMNALFVYTWETSR